MPEKFESSGSNLTKLFHVTCCESGMIIWVQVLEGWHPKTREGKNSVELQNSVWFLTISDFDRELSHEQMTRRKSEDQVINYNPSHIGRKN